MQTLRNGRDTQQRPRSAQKRHFYGCRKNTYINELTYKISDDFFVIFRVVKHSNKILTDNQLFTGLRDGSPGLSLGTPIRPTERFRNRVFIKALYAGGWAVQRPTCVSKFDTKYRF